jgi:DNA-binding phage protein
MAAVQKTQIRQRKPGMALTKDFKQTVMVRIQNEPAYAHALLQEATTLLLQGEPQTAKVLLRDLINATMGFEHLAVDVQKPAKSLHRMLSGQGNPTMTHLSAILAAVAVFMQVQVQTKVIRA